MRRIYGVIIAFIFCHQLMAQTDSLKINRLPFYSNLIKINKANDSNLIKEKDSLQLWEPIQKIDATKNWKVVGLKTTESGYHGKKYHNVIHKYKAKDTLLIINSDSLYNCFKLNKSGSEKKRSWSLHNSITAWKAFRHNKFLIISQQEHSVGNMYEFTTIYEYYFEEIK